MKSKYKSILSEQSLLAVLLKDQSVSTKVRTHNILWATDDYQYKGEGFCYRDEILSSHIYAEDQDLIIPRVLKDKSEQNARSKDMAEVFTPSWLCNRMNNAADEQWFGRYGVFNVEIDASESSLRWETIDSKISFPEGKEWESYIKNTRLEITCGEAPFLVSRYDTTTGVEIAVGQRIGILDRKLRVVKENTESEEQWYEWAAEAYKSVYGYEWQGDSLWLARQALMISYLEYFEDKFGKLPNQDRVLETAEIISWNLWQMDGLKYVVPGTCHEVSALETGDLFAENQQFTMVPCPGCESGDPRLHNGIKCKIMDWSAGKPVLFIDTIKR